MGESKQPKEEVRIFRPDNIPGIEVWSARNITYGSTFFHDTYTVCSITDFVGGGGADWRYRGRRLFSREKSLMMMEPGETHVTDRVTGLARYFVLRIEPDFLAGMAREVKPISTPHLKIASLEDSSALKNFVRFHTALEDGSSRLEIESRLTHCMSFFLNRCTENPFQCHIAFPHERGLVRARDYIHSHVTEDISLSTLATISGLSRFHFLRSFKAKFGLPPHGYQLRARVTKAMSLLSRDPNDLERFDLGFSDQSHFIRNFKQVVGITPGKYAELLRRPFSGATA